CRTRPAWRSLVHIALRAKGSPEPPARSDSSATLALRTADACLADPGRSETRSHQRRRSTEPHWVFQRRSKAVRGLLNVTAATTRSQSALILVKMDGVASGG